MIKRRLQTIVLNYWPLKERDLVVRLLSKEGKKLSVLFRGGAGGGPQKKSRLVEIGHCLNVVLARPGRGEMVATDPLYMAKEWELHWQHRAIRSNYAAFALVSLMVELVDRIALESAAEELFSDELPCLQESGLYTLLANALFYCDQAVEQKHFASFQQGFCFLAKLIANVGFMPQLSACLECGADLERSPFIGWDFATGGFYCADHHQQRLANHRKSYLLLRKIQRLRYHDYLMVEGVVEEDFTILLSYVLYQCGLEKRTLRSLSGLLSSHSMSAL